MQSSLVQSIKKRKDFLQLRKAKTRVVGKFLIINFKSSSIYDYISLGITVSKKHGSAVKRNFIKRRLKAIFIKNIKVLPKGYTFELIPKEIIKNYDFLSIEQDFLKVIKKLNCSNHINQLKMNSFNRKFQKN